MGWSGGTDIFDSMFLAIRNADISREAQKQLIRTLVDSLEDQDWDTQDDSAYWHEDIVQEAVSEDYQEDEGPEYDDGIDMDESDPNDD